VQPRGLWPRWESKVLQSVAWKTWKQWLTDETIDKWKPKVAAGAN